MSGPPVLPDRPRASPPPLPSTLAPPSATVTAGGLSFALQPQGSPTSIGRAASPAASFAPPSPSPQPSHGVPAG
jgi:hypothetical protein